MCVNKAQSENFECRPYDHFQIAAATPRFNNPTFKANVCLPKSPGWVGDHCLSSAECGSGTTCLGATATRAGICSIGVHALLRRSTPAMPTRSAPRPAARRVAAASAVHPSSNRRDCPSDMACTGDGT